MSNRNPDFDTPKLPHEYPEAEITCPECDAAPTEESERNVHLSDIGYLHADTSYVCSECDYGREQGERWVHGVPVGEATEFAEDLQCDKCDEGWYLIHRIQPLDDEVRLHKKCPICADFCFGHREIDNEGRVLVGYPQITGDLNPDKPYGYTTGDLSDDGEGSKPPECEEEACIIHGNGTLFCPNSKQ